MAAPEPPVPLSAVGLRLTDEVGQTVLDWVAAGDLAASAALDQHVTAIRAALAMYHQDEVGAARLAGQAAGQTARSQAARSGAARSRARRPHRSRRSATASGAAARPAATAAGCPDVPFADSAWYADEVPPLRLLLHYACGFVEAAVRADWWPGERQAANGEPDFEALRLAGVCRLIRQAEMAAVLPPDPALSPRSEG